MLARAKNGTEQLNKQTIFALSSGLPPAGIAVIRVSGPGAGAALAGLAGRLPEPRAATLCRFRDRDGTKLDTGLAIWFPGPASATGEDVAEFHVHGGRAVVAAMLTALAAQDGLRTAQPGEFTRRAFENGRIDLAEAEGLADLLAAETEGQRQSALALAEGGLGRRVADWQKRLLHQAALVEAELDHSDEDDVAYGYTQAEVLALTEEMASLLAAPPAERLRDGVRIVLAGPPNSGKSSLFNALIERDAAIVSAIAGTTRDRIEAPVQLDGLPLLLIDTAGLHGGSGDAIEDIGMERTGAAMDSADLILWLGPSAQRPDSARSIQIVAKADLGSQGDGLLVSALTGAGLDDLKREMISRAQSLLPKAGALALNQRHRAIIADVCDELAGAARETDLLIIAEHLRASRNRLDALTGRAGVEDMLDALFGTFCIGK